MFLEAGVFSHPCENDLVVWSTSGKIPFFNAQIYFENIEPIGKVDEIFGGPKENVCISLTMMLKYISVYYCFYYLGLYCETQRWIKTSVIQERSKSVY